MTEPYLHASSAPAAAGVHDSDGAALRSAGRGRIAVTAVFTLNGLVFAAWVSRIPAIRDALDLGSERLGLVLLCMSLGAVLALPSTGAIVPRLGAAGTVRAAGIVCTTGLALTGIAGGVAGGVPLLLVGLFLMGFGSGGWDVAMNVEGAEVERRLDRAIMPQFHGAWSIGSVVGAGLGALLNAVHLPTAVHLVGTAVLVVVGVQLSCTWFLPATRHDDQEHQPERRNPFAAWLEPRTIAIGFLVLAFAFTEGSANDWLAVAVVDGYHVANATGVLTFTVFTAAMTTGRLFGTRLLDRFGRVMVLRTLALVALAGLLLVIEGGSMPLVAAGALLWGIGASLGFPVGMSAAAHDPAHAAARVSVVASIGYTAFLAGPPAIGFLAHHVGTLDSLWVVLVVLVLGFVAAGAAREDRDERAPA
ncbi:MAG TPA: MFS transporter [Actinomycetales bacterium]|nr:MFS transporter [Actinomycetales bacterium]